MRNLLAKSTDCNYVNREGGREDRIPSRGAGSVWRDRVRQESNDEKMKELILYIAHRCQSDDTFGATKLNKLLFLSDFVAHLRLGKAITGHEYQALPKGPAPKALVPLRKLMIHDHEVVVVETNYFGRAQHKWIPKREPRLALFSGDEIALVDQLIATWWGKNAESISEASHGFLGWMLAKEKETIPYCVALVSRRAPTPDEVRRGRELEPLARHALEAHAG